MIKQVFCTFFDSNYLAQGLTLYNSLKRFGASEFLIYILCLDQKLFHHLKTLKLENVSLIALDDIENLYPDLKLAKKNRSLIEYYFTLSPFLPLYVLENYHEPHVASLDADIMFFSSPNLIFEELDQRSIYIVPHRFRDNQSHLKKYGEFNVQCQIFKNNSAGLDCLNYWSKNCLNWCFDRYEDGKFADQKYLDEWPEKYIDDIVISSNKGIGVAPWNIEGEDLKLIDNKFYINNEPIIFYHFHGLKLFNNYLVKLGLSTYSVSKSKTILNIYKTYLNSITKHGSIAQQKSIRSGGYNKVRLLLSSIKHKDLYLNFNN